MANASTLPGLFAKLSYQGVAKNTVYQLIGKVFTALSTLFIVRLVNTHYGEGGAGELTTLLNYLNIFYLLSDFGINAIAVKQMIEKPEEKTRIYQQLTGLRIASSVALMLIAVIVATILPYNPATGVGFSPTFKFGILLLSATILSQGIYQTAVALYQSHKDYKAPSIAIALGSIASLTVFLALSSDTASFLLPLSGLLVGGIVSAAVAVVLLPLSIAEKLRPLFTWTQWKQLVVPSLPIAATLICNVIYFKSDSLIMRSLISTEEVGIYGVAYKVFDQAIVIPIFFVNALYPVLLEKITYTPAKVKQTLTFAAGILLVGGILIGAIQFLFAPLLVEIVKGSAASIAPLRILAVGLPFFFVSNVFLWLLVTLNKQKYLIAIYGASMIFNIVANFIFIPKYSYIASAVLTGISEAIVLALTMGFGIYFLKKYLKEKLHAAENL